MCWHDYSSNQIIHRQNTSCNSCPTKRFNSRGVSSDQTRAQWWTERERGYSITFLGKNSPTKPTSKFACPIHHSKEKILPEQILMPHTQLAPTLTTKRQTPYRISLQELITLITIVIDPLGTAMYNLGFLTFEDSSPTNIIQRTNYIQNGKLHPSDFFN